MKNKTYVAIDLKSFYASVECVERGLDPLKTNLVVADKSRTEKTICLAVSPSLKAYGIPGRARLFEVVEAVARINALRRARAPGHVLKGASSDADVLRDDPSMELDYIVARPQMAHYVTCSTRVFDIYMKHAAPEDIHVYSIDEVFIDATDYLRGRTPYEYTKAIIRDVLDATGVTATAGIGTNLYLSKVAMDIVAKHIPADKDGVRIAALDEAGYREQLWEHRPLTDFWRVGHGYSRKLEARGMFTMGDVARCSLKNEELLYKLFGVNAELLIDHAWGWEPCTIADIKAYKPEENSISVGQVLKCPYDFRQGRMIVREMTDALVLDLLEKGLTTEQIGLSVGYDTASLTDRDRRRGYRGEVTTDWYGREVPKHANGTANLGRHTSSERIIMDAMMALYDRIVDENLLVRRMCVAANRVAPEREDGELGAGPCGQMSLFDDHEAEVRQAEMLARERSRQQAVLDIRGKFGKNAIFRGTSLQEGATGRERNEQIGGHRA